MSTVAAFAFVVLTSLAVAFQLALVAGLPWGELAMGGRFPGKFPPALRALAVVQALLLVLFGAVVLIRADLVLPEWRDFSGCAVWFVVAFSALSVVANLATPSKWERILWAPVALGLLACSLVVALG